jgi:hypothetical protein
MPNPRQLNRKYTIENTASSRTMQNNLIQGPDDNQNNGLPSATDLNMDAVSAGNPVDTVDRENIDT